MNAKRIAQWIVIGIATALIVFAYFQLSQPQTGKGNPLAVVPASSALACSFDDFGNATEELNFFKMLLREAQPRSAMKGWLQALQQLDSLRTRNRNWYDLLQSGGVSFQKCATSVP
jgi:hypothetical protein